ncbi:MAG: Rnase Y domain-containing protein, partial [Thermodesulfobacteriota bacterium]
MSAWIVILVAAISLVIGFAVHYLYRQLELKKNIGIKKDEAQTIIELAEKEAEKVKIEGELKAKEIREKRTAELDRESREKQKEFSKVEKRLQKKEETLDGKFESFDKKEKEVLKLERDMTHKEKALEEKEKELDAVVEDAKQKIEQIAGMTQEAAKTELINIIEDEARHQAAIRLKQIEEQ